ncbi:MAG: class I SAM-dependent RNA methyltransferase [Sandaracinaceae bacterium]
MSPRERPPRDGHALFLTAPSGTEPALKDEIKELGLAGAKAARGGVRVWGSDEALARLCLRSRIATRVLVEVARFECDGEDALYDGVHSVEWQRWLSTDRTLAVTATGKDARKGHTHYLAQRTKDAIVDRQREGRGARSDVDPDDPDVGVVVHLAGGEAGVFLDASGGPLFLRGWRKDSTEAPLKENLAAAILRLSGWDRERPLVDPMCGSGTFPIEGWLWAQDGDAQASDRRFGFERWADHEEARAEALARARARPRRPREPACFGSDRDPSAVEAARSNATRAGARVQLSVRELAEVSLPEGAHVVLNPPYGERLEADVESWRALEDALRRWSEHHVAALIPEDAPRLDLGRPTRVVRLYNGAIPCRLVVSEPRQRGARAPGRRGR